MPTQEEINDGQKRINGELCRVDWRVINVLQEMRTVLAQLGGPSLDLSAIDAAILEADLISEKVAMVDPPGCRPSDRKSAG